MTDPRNPGAGAPPGPPGDAPPSPGTGEGWGGGAPHAAAHSAPPLLRLDGVTKVFAGGITALSGLSLDLREGDFVSLLGPSGCGKSTALRLMAGLSHPTSGRLAWREGADHELGFVFQEPTLAPWSRVFDNVWLPLRLRGLSRKAAAPQVEAALDAVGLADFVRAFPRELSGGMKMRVSIARAMVTRPRLLLMDEPFAALDEITRFRLNRDLLRLSHDLGCTVVFVTHSVFESVFLSSRIVVMAARPGRVVEEIAVEGPAERDEAFRTSAAYAAQCRAVSQALERAMEGAA